MVDERFFIEQAEYLEKEDLKRWDTEHPNESQIIKKILGKGAKLITGPRGCGKTTLLKKAFHKALDAKNSILPVYVNFKSSLMLEPFYIHNTNARLLFNQWLIHKILLGLYEALGEIESSDFILLPPHEKLKTEKIISDLEMGSTEILSDANNIINLADIRKIIKEFLEIKKKTRCILLLDDAAHAFSQNQQHDFFEFFRAIKSSFICPKAAVYPGVTLYSPNFHLGHDAEEVNIWLSPSSENYIEFMVCLLKKRLPEEIFSSLKLKLPLLHLLCYCAFGMPRSLINMINFLKSNNADADFSFNRVSTIKAIKDSYQSSLSIFSSLERKLPLYKNFIESGDSMLHVMISHIKSYNQNHDYSYRQTTCIAIKNPIPSEIEIVLSFFQYAGLIFPLDQKHRGEKGTYSCFMPHFSGLVSYNALFGSKTLNPSNYVQVFKMLPSKRFSMISVQNFLNNNSIQSLFSLSLPECSTCGTTRLNESQKFCHNCGAELKPISIFESLVNQDISSLSLTKKRVDKIKKESDIKTIKDIVMDFDRVRLRRVKGVGPYWAERIYSIAAEFIT